MVRSEIRYWIGYEPRLVCRGSPDRNLTFFRTYPTLLVKKTSMPFVFRPFSS